MTSASQVLTEARKYLGIRVGSAGHHAIVDTYNAHKPLALGYKVRYTDNWCDAFVSFVMIKLSATALTDTECGVERHTKLFAKLGIWIEDGTITPKPGDIIVHNWDDTSQPNDGFADHIGFVESVSGRTITTIEGNKGVPGTVARRQISVGNGVIRGYARPKYSGGGSVSTPPATSQTTGGDLVVDGYFGVSSARRAEALENRTQDGVISSQDIAWTNAKGYKFIDARALPAVQWVPSKVAVGSQLVGIWQQRLGLPVDYKIGLDFYHAALRYYGFKIDNSWTAPSNLVKAMQRQMNKGQKLFS